MSGTGLSSETRVKYFQVGDIVADSDAFKHALWYLPRRIKITAVRFAVDTAITAADTNYQTAAVTDGTNTIASIVTGPASGGQSMSVGTWYNKAVVAAQAEKAAGTTIKLELTKTGSGMAMSALAIQIEYVEYGA